MFCAIVVISLFSVLAVLQFQYHYVWPLATAGIVVFFFTCAAMCLALLNKISA